MVDIHCATKWTKLDTMWTGVSVGAPDDEPGLRETYGNRNHGDPWLEQRYQGD